MVEEVPPTKTLQDLSLDVTEEQFMENMKRIVNDPQYYDTAEEEIE